MNNDTHTYTDTPTTETNQKRMLIAELDINVIIKLIHSHNWIKQF